MAKNQFNNFRDEYSLTPNDKIYVKKEEPVTPIEEDFGDHNVLEGNFDGCIRMKKSLSASNIFGIPKDLLNLDNNEVYEGYDKSLINALQLAKAKKPQNRSRRPALTRPQSPMLRSKARARPVHIMSQQEKEDKEFEKLKKIKIKAHPVPKSVIEGPINLPEVQKKPLTVPKPFKLTEVQKKPLHLPEYPYKFKARPAPKHILEKPRIPYKPLKIQNKQNELPTSTRQIPTQKQRHGPLRAEPFSFAKRDEELKQRKEAWIKQQIEEERKQAALFKAQPLPDAVKKQMSKIKAQPSFSPTSDNKENHVKFDFRPPTAPFKEPSKRQPFQPTKTVPFAMATEKRAAERDKFDQLIIKKEEFKE